MRMLLARLIHLRSSQPEWLPEVAPQLRSRQVLAPAYLSRALYPPGFIICNVGPRRCTLKRRRSFGGCSYLDTVVPPLHCKLVLIDVREVLLPASSRNNKQT